MATLYKISDGLTKREAESLQRKTALTERKLRDLGGDGNYRRVFIEESFRRGFTLDNRDDLVRYRVMAEMNEA